MPAKPALWDLFKRSWNVASIFSICFDSHTEKLAKNKKSKKKMVGPTSPSLHGIRDKKKTKKQKTFRCESKDFAEFCCACAYCSSRRPCDWPYSTTTQTGTLGRLSNHNVFQKKKILEMFCKRTNKIKDSNMQPLKTSKPFQLTWTLGKQSSNLWMKLVRLQKKIDNLLLSRGCDRTIFLPRFEYSHCDRG